MRTLLAVAAALLALAPIEAAGAAEPYVIHGILPLTGGASFIGVGQRDTLSALKDSVNATGGIGGRPLEFSFHDDQTSPQLAVQLTNEVLATKPPVIIGSAIVAMCNAMSALIKSAAVHYCTSPGFHPKDGGFAFSAGPSTHDDMEVLVRYLRLSGWTHIAAMTGTDATGQDADEALKTIFAKEENRGLRLVELQHFAPADVSVAAQIERIRASGAQALIAWATGSPVATIFRGAVQAGLDIPIGTSPGNQSVAQMEQYLAFLPKRLLFPSPLYPAMKSGLGLVDARVEAEQRKMYPVLEAHGLRADNFIGTAWDPGLILVAALRKLGPDATAEQLRAQIAGLKSFAGVDGIYDFRAYPERGLGPNDVAIVTYDAKAKGWAWISKPGGAPMAR